jgi:uncharacterized OB-fold protein
LLEPETAFFWTSGEEGVLKIQRCRACGHWQHPPLPRCPKCHSAELAPQAATGRGRVATFTVNHQVWSREEDPRFVFAAIELDEQPELYVFSNVLCDPAQAYTGMRVAVTFESQDDVWLPLFVPEQADG